MSTIQHKPTKPKHRASGSDEGYSRAELPTVADIKRTREAMKKRGYVQFTAKQAMRRLFGR